MGQERLDVIEFLPVAAYVFQVPINHLVTSGFVTMQDQAYLSQAETHALTGLNDTKPAAVLFAVIPVTRRGPVRYDDPFVLPVAQHMGGYTEFCSGDSDLHSPMMSP